MSREGFIHAVLEQGFAVQTGAHIYVFVNDGEDLDDLIHTGHEFGFIPVGGETYEGGPFTLRLDFTLAKVVDVANSPLPQPSSQPVGEEGEAA